MAIAAGLAVQRDYGMVRPLSPRPASPFSGLVVPPFGTNTGPASLFDERNWSPGRRRRNPSPLLDRPGILANQAFGGNQATQQLQQQRQQQREQDQPAFGKPSFSPRNGSQMVDLLRDHSPTPQDENYMSVTLTRHGWSRKKAVSGRNSSPGVSNLLHQNSSSNVKVEEGRSPMKHRPSSRPQAFNSTNIRSILQPPPRVPQDPAAEEASGEAAAAIEAPLVDQSKGAAGRRRTLQERGGDRFQRSEGVSVALRPKPAAAPQVRSPSPRLVAPWDSDSGVVTGLVAADSEMGSKMQRLTDVARSAMQAAALRVNADKLYLRDMDMTRDVLGAGTGMGRGGSIQPVGMTKSFKETNSGTGSVRAMAQCRDEVSGAVAALMAKEASRKSSESLQQRALPQRSHHSEVSRASTAMEAAHSKSSVGQVRSLTHGGA